MMAFAFISLMRIIASPEKAVVARPAPRQPIGSLARRVSQAMARSAR